MSPVTSLMTTTTWCQSLPRPSALHAQAHLQHLVAALRCTQWVMQALARVPVPVLVLELVLA